MAKEVFYPNRAKERIGQAVIHRNEETLEKFHSLSELEDKTEDEKRDIIPSGLLIEELNNKIEGVPALIEKRRGYYLYGLKNSTEAYFKANSIFTVYIYDVTDLVGGSFFIRYSYFNNLTEYKIVSDYSIIGTSSTDISSVLLASGENHSTPSSHDYNCHTVEVDLKKAQIVSQATIGRVYALVTLHNNFEQLPLYSTKGLGTRIAEIEKYPLYPWVAREKQRIVDLLKRKLNHEIAIIGFNTDQHIRQKYKGTYTDPVIRGLRALRDMAEEIPFNLICLGGDAAGYTSETTQEKVDADVLEVINAVDTDKCPVIYITGNHDAGQNINSSTFGDTDGFSIFNTALKRNVVRREVDDFNNRSTNCWFDDNALKIRFIFMDAWARANGPKPNNYKTYTALMTILQSALEDTKLTDGSGWSVIIFSHSTFAPNTVKFDSDIEKNNSDPLKSDCWNLVMQKINQGMKVIACFNGQGHTTRQSKRDGVLFIQTQQAGNVGTNQTYPCFDGIRYTPITGSATETAFDVFLIDKTDKKIYAYRYGFGMDRLFYYEDNPRIALCHLSGTITIDGEVATGSITAKHHNTIYSSELDGNGHYNFPYLCPECDWELSFGNYTELYQAVEGEITKNINL